MGWHYFLFHGHRSSTALAARRRRRQCRLGKDPARPAVGGWLECRHVELDALHWEPGSTEAEPEVFRERAAEAISAHRWVVDGGYTAVRDLVWQAADTLVWLDYSYPRVLGRLLSRTARRLVRRERLWQSNRETLRNTLSRNSLFVWQATQLLRKRRTYGAAAASHPHLTVLRFRRPGRTEHWLRSLTDRSTGR